MPIYEFECLFCRKRSEKLIRSEEEMRALRCDFCGGKKLKKLFSRFGIAAGRLREESLQTSASGSCSSCVSKNCAQCR